MSQILIAITGCCFFVIFILQWLRIWSPHFQYHLAQKPPAMVMEAAVSEIQNVIINPLIHLAPSILLIQLHHAFLHRVTCIL